MAAPSLTLLDWRRRVFALYAAVRDRADPPPAHALWRSGATSCSPAIPQSPIPQARGRRSRASRWRRTTRPGASTSRWSRPSRTRSRSRPARTGSSGSTGSASPRCRGIGTLDVWWLGGYGGGVFVPVKDASCGRTSYGGGRYLLDTVKGADLGGDAAQGPAGPRPQLRLPPVLRLRPGVGLPARAGRQRPGRRRRRRRAAAGLSRVSRPDAGAAQPPSRPLSSR
jgi:hypothetical protein